MTEAQIRETIFEIIHKIAPEADFEELSADENLREALDIDSFDFLNVLIGLNEALGVEIPEADYGQLQTLTELIAYLTKKL